MKYSNPPVSVLPIADFKYPRFVIFYGFVIVEIWCHTYNRKKLVASTPRESNLLGTGLQWCRSFP
jgi:hypothetical protein